MATTTTTAALVGILIGTTAAVPLAVLGFPILGLIVGGVGGAIGVRVMFKSDTRKLDDNKTHRAKNAERWGVAEWAASRSAKCLVRERRKSRPFHLRGPASQG